MRGLTAWRVAAVAATAVLGVGIAAAPALAKGADQATITGPALAHPVVVGGDGEPGGSSALAQLSEGSGLFPAMFGAGSGAGLVAHRPAGRLGPRYTLEYRVPADVPLRVRQDLYPLAEGGPVTYTRAGQPAFGGERTFGGWYTAPPTFAGLLASVGVPATGAAPVSTTAAGQAAGAGAAADGDTRPADAAPASTGPRPGRRGWVLPTMLAVLLAAGATAVAAVTVSRRRGASPGTAA
jgi:hypothetical protein